MKNVPIKTAAVVCSFLFLHAARGETTNLVTGPLMAPTLPNAGASFIRVLGALAVVIGIFLAGVWLYKNWQRLTIQRGRAPKLNVLETRPLGGRQALYVVGYEQERFLVASSTAGVSLLTPLPDADEPEPIAKASPAPSFAQALTQVLKGK